MDDSSTLSKKLLNHSNPSKPCTHGITFGLIIYGPSEAIEGVPGQYRPYWCHARLWHGIEYPIRYVLVLREESLLPPVRFQCGTMISNANDIILILILNKAMYLL